MEFLPIIMESISARCEETAGEINGFQDQFGS